jgi:hypothetical protein
MDRDLEGIVSIPVLDKSVWRKPQSETCLSNELLCDFIIHLFKDVHLHATFVNLPYGMKYLYDYEIRMVRIWNSAVQHSWGAWKNNNVSCQTDRKAAKIETGLLQKGNLMYCCYINNTRLGKKKTSIKKDILQSEKLTFLSFIYH